MAGGRDAKGLRRWLEAFVIARVMDAPASELSAGVPQVYDAVATMAGRMDVTFCGATG